MFFIIISVLTFLSLSTTEASEYYIYKEHTTWTEALNSCALALPEFREESGETVVSISNTVTDDLWVGYYKALVGFEYKGCIRNTNFTPRMESAKLTIGLCYYACGRKQIVGISGKKMNFDEDVQFTFCYRSRNYIENVHNTCDQNGCVSIYKVNNKVTKHQTRNVNDGMCLKFESVRYGRYAWTDCGQHNLAFCDFEYDNSLSGIQYGYMASKDSPTVLRFIDTSTEKKMVLCRNDLSINTEEASTSSVPETEISTSTDVSSNPGYRELNEEEDADSLDLDVGAIIGSSFGCVLVITAAAVILVTYKRRRTNQGIRQSDVGKVPEHSNNITPISDEARGGAYTTIQDNATRGASEEIEMQNPQKIVYESLGERNDEEHGYGTANTHRSAYESLGDRHHEEHGYGTPNAQRSTYESLGERHNEEHSYGVYAKGTSGFYQSLEEERIDTHNYEIAGQPREIAFDSPGDKIKDTHCDGTSSQKDNIKLYEWVE